MLEPAYELLTPFDVSRLFGQPFADNFEGLSAGQWHGPFKSGFGFHLVRVDEVVSGRLPELEEVRGPVVREWENMRRNEARESFYDELLARYQVSVEYPEAFSAGLNGSGEN